MVTVGKAVADFEADSTSGTTRKLSELKGQNVVIYFYPKDSTPGCTREGQEFRDSSKAFAKANTVILGVSRDSMKSHLRFAEKQEFDFELLSDPDEKLCKAFDVIKEKNMYGRKVMGIERSTFLIDAKGVLRQEWRKVRVPGHVDAVLEAAQALD
ncbi:MAG: peroxiredoxin [Xanthomonadales bacterium]|nr:peroxiredoxin [Xanthomonadales bacterium]